MKQLLSSPLAYKTVLTFREAAMLLDSTAVDAALSLIVESVKVGRLRGTLVFYRHSRRIALFDFEKMAQDTMGEIRRCEAEQSQFDIIYRDLEWRHPSGTVDFDGSTVTQADFRAWRDSL
jgi:hypothetical protein